MHSSYIPQSSSSARASSRHRRVQSATSHDRRVQSATPTRNRNPARIHRRKLSNPASLGAPLRPVTPTDQQQHAPWTDSPRSLPYPSPHAVPPEVVLGHSVRASDVRSGITMDVRSVVSDMPVDLPTPVDEEMPMDEAEHALQRVSPAVLDSMRQQVEASQKEVERLTTLLQKSQSQAVDAADRGGGVGAVMSDEVSSLGDDDQTNKLNKLVQAIEQSKRPTNLVGDEKALWDAYQSSLTTVKTEASQQRMDLEKQVKDSGNMLDQVRVREKILQEQLEETTQELHSLQKEMAAQKENQSKSVEAQQRQKAAQAMKVRHLEDQLADMEAKYKEAQELVETQQEEHDRAICAIQRVLADVTTERDEAVEDLQAKLEEAKAVAATREAPLPAGEDDDSASVQDSAKKAVQLEREMGSLQSMLHAAEKDRDSVKQDLEQKGGKIVILEQEIKVIKAVLQKAEAKEADLNKKIEEKSQIIIQLEGDLASARHQVETLTKRDEEMTVDAEAKQKEIHKLRRMQRHMRLENHESSKAAAKGEEPSGDTAALQKELAETQSSLESAKKIILSLESANGSLAQDLRGKLKEKEETVQTLQTEATERKRNLDSLATELRDLQRRKSEMDHMDHWSRSLIRKQQVLALQLETSLNELQSAAVVFESTIESGTPDSDAVDNISRLIANTLGAVKYASTDSQELETLERTASHDEQLDVAAGGSLRQELEERKIQVNALEDALKQHKEELEALKRESTQSQLKREEDETKLRSEILMLRDQCKTNMEVLAKKERELEVLRDSLDVGDEGVGYISDDASSDGEDEGRAMEAPMSPSGSVYSHSQAEALATLMANGSMDTASVEVDKLRRDLKKASVDKEKAAKELKAERESLANAKMIISSLERANKSMMEDLRQRLQDSNTAIASLLDKSMQSEKQSTALRNELEQVKREKEEEAEKHKLELQKLKDDSSEQALQMAAKDREILELRSNESTPAEAAEESKEEN